MYTITIKGVITPKTSEDMKKAVADRKELINREGGGSSAQWWMIYLDSPGGDVAAAINTGRLLRSAEAPVQIRAGQECISACVLILAGATERLIYGKVGIHRPYLEALNGDLNYPKVQHAYDAMTETIRSYLAEMDVSEKLADDMMTVAPERVRFLSVDELVHYGLGIVDPVLKEEIELKNAQKLGIDRREYMRRQNLIDAFCRSPMGSAGSAEGLERPQLKSGSVSRACYDGVLSGKHVEKAPPCRNGALTCRPWERQWNGRIVGNGDVVSEDGFIISGGR